MSGKKPTRPRNNNHLTIDQTKLMMDYINKHPTATWSQYMAETNKKAACSDAYYYMRRREVHGLSRPAPVPSKNPVTGRRSYVRSNSGLYHTIWSYPTEKLNQEARDVLNDFVTHLNNMKRARFEIIELKIPPVIEVRETSR
jgi:hypothetical protein